VKKLLAILLTIAGFLSLGAWFSLVRSIEMDFNTALAAGELAGDWPTAGAVNKFGFNADVDTSEESVWDMDDLPTNTAGPGRCFANMATTAAPLCISSDNVADAGLGVTVEALDANWAPVTISATLGVAAVTSGTVLINPLGTVNLLRINRAYATSTALTGNIYIHKDCTADTGNNGIPDTPATDIVAGITAGENQTLQACYTVPLGFNALMTQFCIGNLSQAAAAQTVTFRLRKSVAGAASRTTELMALADSVQECVIHDPPSKFTEKTDIELTALAGGASQGTSGTFDLLIIPNTL